MDSILDFQDLLEKYYRAEIGVISEYSGSIQEDRVDLMEAVDEFARFYGLSAEFLDRDRELNKDG